MRTIVAGNWKMNTDRHGAADLANGVVKGLAGLDTSVEVVLAPPFPFLAATVEQVRGSRVTVAAQNCHEADQGAYTGEVSVPMLKSIGVTACIVGHSERRQYFGETDATIARKIDALLTHGLTPIFCCGEVKAERGSGRHEQVVTTQLDGALGHLSSEQLLRVVIAYEPVWAIGTGLTATPQQAQDMHAHIRAWLQQRDAASVPVLYGGSCKPDNAAGLFDLPDINGGLIGGAALDAGSFVELVRLATEAGH
jgi:triosephosphate isomerase